MTYDRYSVISSIDSSLQGGAINRELFQQLREKSRDSAFLKDFDPAQFEKLVSKIFPNSRNLVDQLDVIAAIANVLYLNENLRNSADPVILKSLSSAIPHLFQTLDFVSERQINSESQYKDFLPIFRVYFFLAHNHQLLPSLKSSVLKISGKLLNFIALSSNDSSNLNIIIIEILKIIYTYLHQVEDTTGIDSSFVLSCNKFQSLYSKEAPKKEYDEILNHYGNVLMTISTDTSQNYMLNKLKFTQNEVSFINRLIETPSLISPVSNLLALDILLTIDYEDSGVKSHILKNLNFDKLSSFQSIDPNLTIVINELKNKLENYVPHSPSTPPLSLIPPLSSPPLEYNHRLGEILTDAAESKENDKVPRFEELSEQEQDVEIEKMSQLFDKIEKNGMFKFKMK